MSPAPLAAVGICGIVALTRALGRMPCQVSTLDPVVIGAVAAVLSLLALLGGHLPAQGLWYATVPGLPSPSSDFTFWTDTPRSRRPRPA